MAGMAGMAGGSSEAIKNHASFIWSAADLLRGDYKQSEYGRVILPFLVLRRLDQVLALTRAAVWEADEKSRQLPEALREKVFQRFFRLDTSRSTPGTGLGLSLAQAVAMAAIIGSACQWSGVSMMTISRPFSASISAAWAMVFFVISTPPSRSIARHSSFASAPWARTTWKK